jgi:RimJ/RimL family protein N-acetyltransferase
VSACPTIETPRLLLRPFREADLDAYTAMMQTPEVRASLYLPDDYGREAAWQQMAAFSGQWVLRNHGQWALEEKSSGVFVGRAGAHRPERDDWPGIEIGWALHPDHWGKGYATEAGGAAIDWVFAHHDVDELFSLILHANRASQAVAERLGFTLAYERVMKFFPSAPHGVWKLTRAAWSERAAQAQARAT